MKKIIFNIKLVISYILNFLRIGSYQTIKGQRNIFLQKKFKMFVNATFFLAIKKLVYANQWLIFKNFQIHFSRTHMMTRKTCLV